MDNEVVKAAVNLTGEAGTIVITGVGYYDMVLPGRILIGSTAGCRAHVDVSRTKFSQPRSHLKVIAHNVSEALMRPDSLWTLQNFILQ